MRVKFLNADGGIVDEIVTDYPVRTICEHAHNFDTWRIDHDPLPPDLARRFNEAPDVVRAEILEYIRYKLDPERLIEDQMAEEIEAVPEEL